MNLENNNQMFTRDTREGQSFLITQETLHSQDWNQLYSDEIQPNDSDGVNICDLVADMPPPNFFKEHTQASFPEGPQPAPFKNRLHEAAKNWQTEVVPQLSTPPRDLTDLRIETDHYTMIQNPTKPSPPKLDPTKKIFPYPTINHKFHRRVQSACKDTLPNLRYEHNPYQSPHQGQGLDSVISNGNAPPMPITEFSLPSSGENSLFRYHDKLRSGMDFTLGYNKPVSRMSNGNNGTVIIHSDSSFENDADICEIHAGQRKNTFC
jgi:hypothetical protein